MTQSFFIPMVLPNLNDMVKAAKQGRRGYQPYAKQKAQVEQVICQCIRKAKLKAVVYPVVLHMIWTEPNRRRDKSNVRAGVKFIEDALVKSGILNNDGWNQIHHHKDYYMVDKQHPGVMVHIYYPERHLKHGTSYIGTSAHPEPV